MLRAVRSGTAHVGELAESFGVYRWLRQESVSGALPPADPDSVESFDDHMLFYATEERAALAAFLDASSERSPTLRTAPEASR